MRPEPPAPADPLNDPDLDRPRSWWDAPRLSLDALSPGQRYTAFLTVVLAVALMAFGVERGPRAASGTDGSTLLPANRAPTRSATTVTTAEPLEPPALPRHADDHEPAVEPVPSATPSTTTTSPPPSSTPPPENEPPPEQESPLPLPSLPL